MTDLNALKYTAEHEWISIDGDVATVGITDFAADKLGDVVFVELPGVDSGVSAGQVVGEITSGALSPTLGHPIAMAFVSPDLSAPGTALTIDVRGTRIPATVTALPFYRRTK